MIIDFEKLMPEKCRSSGARKRGKRCPARCMTAINIAKDSFHGRWLESAIEQNLPLELGLYITPNGYQVIIQKSGSQSEDIE